MFGCNSTFGSTFFSLTVNFSSSVLAIMSDFISILSVIGVGCVGSMFTCCGESVGGSEGTASKALQCKNN